MRVDVNISDSVLEWILKQVRFETLPPQVADYFVAWKNGDKLPTYNQVEQASKATGIPLGYFFLKEPPDEDVSFVEYRTVDSVSLEKPSRDLIDTMHDMEYVQNWMREYLQSEGGATLPFVGSKKHENNRLSFASDIRKLLHIEINWFRNGKSVDDSFKQIRRAISNAGVVVMMNGVVGNNTHRPLAIDEFRAFSLVDDYAPLIFINVNDTQGARLFSLLHEFCHICIGENSLYNIRYDVPRRVKKVETICNAVAGEILVPQSIFISKWSSVIEKLDQEDAIRTLASYFRCGIVVVARRALDNGYIDINLYNSIARRAIKQYNDWKKNGSSGGDYYRTASTRIDNRFFNMLLGSVVTGKTLYSDAFRLTNTNRSTFASLAEHMGGGYK